MDFLKLEDNKEIIDEKVFKNIDKNFLAHLSSLNYSRYGLVKEGLVGSLESNRITFTKGKVTFPSGLSVEVKDSLSKEIPESKTTFLYLEKKVNELKILELDSLLNKDPYKHELFSKDKTDILVLGFVENSKFYFLNRQKQISNLPINGIGLYKGDFRDYVTLRGCKVDKELIDKYLRINSKELKKTGGNNSIMLEKEHIPTLTFKGSTENESGHRHEHWTGQNAGDHKEHTGRGSSYWTGRYSSTTSSAGDHYHIVYITHTNNSQKPLSIEPDYTVFVPIIREY